jgi:hypothetical protein
MTGSGDNTLKLNLDDLAKVINGVFWLIA